MSDPSEDELNTFDFARAIVKADRALRLAEPAPTDETALQAAWLALRPALGTTGWAVGDHCNYREFIAWGWEARGQYAAAPGAPAALSEPAVSHCINQSMIELGQDQLRRLARIVERQCALA